MKTLLLSLALAGSALGQAFTPLPGVDASSKPSATPAPLVFPPGATLEQKKAMIRERMAAIAASRAATPPPAATVDPRKAVFAGNLAAVYERGEIEGKRVYGGQRIYIYGVVRETGFGGNNRPRLKVLGTVDGPDVFCYFDRESDLAHGVTPGKIALFSGVPGGRFDRNAEIFNCQMVTCKTEAEWGEPIPTP